MSFLPGAPLLLFLVADSWCHFLAGHSLVSSLVFTMLGNLRNLLRRHPYISNAAFYGSMFVGAEVSQQMIIGPNSDDGRGKCRTVDGDSVARYAVMGYGVAPAILYPWYKWLDARYIGKSPKVIVKKVVLDVFVLGPVEVFIFFSCMNIMEGERERYSQELREKFWPTVKKEVSFWVPVQLINFILLPASVRMAFVGVCSFVWLNILCWVKRKPVLVSVASSTRCRADSVSTSAATSSVRAPISSAYSHCDTSAISN